jgi:hypothetical protein
MWTNMGYSILDPDLCFTRYHRYRLGSNYVLYSAI